MKSTTKWELGRFFQVPGTGSSVPGEIIEVSSSPVLEVAGTHRLADVGCVQGSLRLILRPEESAAGRGATVPFATVKRMDFRWA